MVCTESSSLLEKLEEIGALYIMARKHTDCTEIDFQTREEVNVEDLNLENLPFIAFTQLLREENRNSTSLENEVRISLVVANWLISQERYWETHELLEDIWHISKGAVKEYFHGLTLLAVAGVQWQTHREDIARSTYTRAVTKLRSSGINRQFVESLPAAYDYPLKINIPGDISQIE